MTREYGNYEKYEKNSVKEEIDQGVNDIGLDTFNRNCIEMLRTLKSAEGEQQRETDAKNFENLLTNKEYADQTIPDRAIH